jgi:hypothetical protein
VWTLEEREQPGRLPRRTANGCIGRTIASEDATAAFRLLHRQRRSRISEVQLLELAATADGAPFCRLKGSGCEAEHLGGDRPALLLIGREQAFRRAGQHGGQLPAEIVGILDARY